MATILEDRACRTMQNNDDAETGRAFSNRQAVDGGFVSPVIPTGRAETLTTRASSMP